MVSSMGCVLCWNGRTPDGDQGRSRAVAFVYEPAPVLATSTREPGQTHIFPCRQDVIRVGVKDDFSFVLLTGLPSMIVMS
jgi:hypothetical protein